MYVVYGTQQLPSGASVSGPYQGRDLSNCGVGRLRVAINCGILSVKGEFILYQRYHACMRNKVNVP